jgi:anti-anti-sigma factor
VSKVFKHQLGENMVANANYKLTGRVDGTNAEHYEHEISSLIQANPASFSIDLSELIYISSLGLRVFLKTAKALQQQNKQLILAQPNSEILSLLVMSGFDKIMLIEK